MKIGNINIFDTIESSFARRFRVMKQKPVPFDAYGQDLTSFRVPEDFVTLYYSDVPFDAHLVPHIHQTIEMMLVMSGTVSIDVHGKIFSMREGDIAIVQPQQVHRTLIHTPEKQYTRYVLHLNTDFVQRLLRSQEVEQTSFDYLFRNCVLQCTPENTLFVANLLEQLHTLECKNRDETREDVYTVQGKKIAIPSMKKYTENGRTMSLQYAYAECLIREFLLYLAMNQNNEKREAAPALNLLVEKAVQYIHEHFHEPELSLQQIAADLFVSQGYLCRMFKKYTGTSVYAFIIQTRLAESQLLLQSGCSVTDACMQSGFNDYSAYLKAFRAAYHMTPRAYIELQGCGAQI